MNGLANAVAQAGTKASYSGAQTTNAISGVMPVLHSLIIQSVVGRVKM